MRAIVGFSVVMVCASSAGLASGLYEGSVIVTGTNLGERQHGLARALGEVLAKASGNPDWATDPKKVTDIDPGPLLVSLAYLDRETNVPKHDEQGTRDRPYDLIARFDPARIDAALGSAADRPWPEPRPLVAIDLAITPRHGTTMAAHADTDADERHRGALLAAADRVGLDVMLPLANGAQNPPPGSPVLRGTMVWSDAAFGWVSLWTLSDPSGQALARWGMTGVGFDEAYREAMRHVARVLSGHAG